MGGQPGLNETRSLTKTGLSQVTLLYKDGTDQLKARQLVTERLAVVKDQLPPGSTLNSPRSPPVSARSIITRWSGSRRRTAWTLPAS
jgi:Cu/Ag efflux pump CusA